MVSLEFRINKTLNRAARFRKSKFAFISQHKLYYISYIDMLF